MPGVISRRTRSARGKSAASNRPSSDVSNFAKVSKLQFSGKNAAEKDTSSPARTSSAEVVLASRKRKVDDDGESTPKKLRRDPSAPQAAEPATPVSRKKKAVRFAETEDAPSTPSRTAATPSSSRKRQLQADETIQAEALLERLNLQSSPVHKRSKTSASRSAAQHDFDLPQELVDLLDLHVAFLKTLSMQLAHNGTNSPVDLRSIYPSVTRTWGKRQVSLDDIQRCVGVLGWTPVKSGAGVPKCPFFLADYGRGKICIEFHPDAEPGPLREHKLNMDFEANLRTLWLSRRGEPITLFIATLPKAAIKPRHALGGRTGTSLAKTQSTLDELKSAAARKQQEKQAKAQPPPTPAPAPAPAPAAAPAPGAATAQGGNPNGSKLTLLDRIRLRAQQEQQKQQQQAGAGEGLSAAEVQRRAALLRAADVAAVIGMLSKASGATAGQARMSFTMAAVLVRLRDSLRTPVSQEDAAVCVRVLAAEVAPRWLRIVTVGGRENVVVQSAFQPSKGEVEERVKELLG